MRPGTNWTSEMDAALTSGFQAGLSARLVGKKLGVTRNAVLGRHFRMGLSKPRVRPGQGEAQRSHSKEDGMSNQELDRAIPDADRKNSLAPVTYIIKLHGPLARALEAYATVECLSAELIIREAVRSYIGDAVRQWQDIEP